MVANRELVRERNISPENVEMIDKIHDLLEKLLALYTLDVPYEEAKELVHSAEFSLQGLWDFPQDIRYHTWIKKLNQKWMNLRWAGRAYRCEDTSEEVMLTYKKVYERSYVKVGNGAIDLGVVDGYYRIIGNIKEIDQKGADD